MSSTLSCISFSAPSSSASCSRDRSNWVCRPLTNSSVYYKQTENGFHSVFLNVLSKVFYRQGQSQWIKGMRCIRRTNLQGMNFRPYHETRFKIVSPQYNEFLLIWAFCITKSGGVDLSVLLLCEYTVAYRRGLWAGLETRVNAGSHGLWLLFFWHPYRLFSQIVAFVLLRCFRHSF